MTPLPPADLAAREPVLEVVPRGAELHRFFSAARDPLHFDRSDLGRLNSPAGAYGVLYMAKSERGAFAVTFLRAPGSTLIAKDVLASKAYVRLRTRRALRLIRFARPGLARLGATAEVVHGGLPYDTAQAWSAALHAHPMLADGIAYNARHDDEALYYAIFDRASDALSESHRLRNLDDNWFWEIAEVYGMGMAP